MSLTLHHHYLSSGGHTLTHAHPDGDRLHDGKMSAHHAGFDRGAYFNHNGPCPRAAQEVLRGDATDEALQAVRAAAVSAAAPDTCLPEDRETWSPDDPLHGHCGPTAYVVYRLFGGTILSGRDSDGVRWLWNQLPDGREVALTEDDWRPLPKRARPFAPKTVNPRFKLFGQRVTEALFGTPVELGLLP